MTFPVTTTIAANDNVDTWLPGAGRTTTQVSDYLANNAVFNVKDYGATGGGSVDDSSEILAAQTAALGAGYTAILFPPGTYKIATNITLTVGLQCMPGAILAPTTGTIITCTGLIFAGRQRIFTTGLTAGTISFVNGTQGTLCPEWWGAVGDGTTDDTAAIQAAITAAQAYLSSPNLIDPRSPVVYVSTGVYAHKGLSVTLPIEIRGEGKQATILKMTVANTPAISVSQGGTGNTYYAYYRFRDFGIEGLNTTTGFGMRDAQDGIYVTSTSTGAKDVPIWIENVRVALMTGNGINLSGFGDTCTVKDCELQYNSIAGIAIGGQFNTNYLVEHNVIQYNRVGISVIAAMGYTLATGRIVNNLIQSNTMGTTGTIGSADRPSQGLYAKGMNNTEIVGNYFENQANDVYLDTPVCTYNRFERNIWEFANSYDLPHTYGGPPTVNMGIYLADGYNNKFINNLSAERPNIAVTHCTAAEWGTTTFGSIYSHVTDTMGANCYLDNVGLDSLGGSTTGTFIVTNSNFSHVIRNQTGALAGGRNLRNVDTFGESQRIFNGVREQWIGLLRELVITTSGTVFNDLVQFASTTATERAQRQVQGTTSGTVETIESMNPYGIVSQTWTDPAGTAQFSQSYGTAAPTTGTHMIGAIVWNSAPTASGHIGFVCTASGTPGTWQPFGFIGPNVSVPGTLSVLGNTSIQGTLDSAGAFGCNNQPAQTSYASGGAVSTAGATNTSPYGFTTAAQTNGIVTLLNNIRAALVANGIMS